MPRRRRQSRPLGVAILALLDATAGLLLLAGVSLSLVSINLGLPVEIATLLSTLLLIAGVLNLASAYGLWTMQSWGWWLAALSWGLSVPSNIILSVVVLLYLYSVRSRFKVRL